jgi:hypothetical protein
MEQKGKLAVCRERTATSRMVGALLMVEIKIMYMIVEGKLGGKLFILGTYR